MGRIVVQRGCRPWTAHAAAGLGITSRRVSRQTPCLARTGSPLQDSNGPHVSGNRHARRTALTGSGCAALTASRAPSLADRLRRSFSISRASRICTSPQVALPHCGTPEVASARLAARSRNDALSKRPSEAGRLAAPWRARRRRCRSPPRPRLLQLPGFADAQRLLLRDEPARGGRVRGARHGAGRQAALEDKP